MEEEEEELEEGELRNDFEKRGDKSKERGRRRSITPALYLS